MSILPELIILGTNSAGHLYYCHRGHIFHRPPHVLPICLQCPQTPQILRQEHDRIFGTVIAEKKVSRVLMPPNIKVLVQRV
jgi:hypothetical protein